MKTKTSFKFAIETIKTLSACLAVMIFAGCKSTGYMKSDATAVRLHETAVDVRAESSNLDVIMNSLSNLVTVGSGDLRVHFWRFSQGVDFLAGAEKRTSSRAAELRKVSAKYFEAWDKELLTMSDSQIRQKSAEHKAEVVSQYENTMRHYLEGQSALTPLVVYLQNIRNALSTDLTASGLQTVREPANNANVKAAAVRDALANSATELEAASARMSSFVSERPRNATSGS